MEVRAAVLVGFAAATAACCAGQVSGSVSLADGKPLGSRPRDLSGVVVSAVPVATATAGPGLTTGHVTMLQKNKMFAPHILPVETGTTVDFPNADPIFHNAFSSFNGQIFDVGLYPPGASRSVRFSRPGVVRVFCNIHPSMSAIIVVLPTKFFTTTNREGAFEMKLPPGTYDLNFFEERATQQALLSLSRRIVVEEKPLRLGVTAISEAGYLQTPHKNKYGKDYGDPPDDQTFYPAVRSGVGK